MRFLNNRLAFALLLNASMICASIGFVAQTGRGDESGLRDIPRAFAPFEYLVGRWNGQGMPKDRSANQFRGWTETHAWAWIFEKGKPVGLSVTIEGGKFLSTGKLSYDAARERYRLEGTEPKPGGGPIAFEGTVVGTGKTLVLDRVGADAKSGKMRLTLWPNATFIRYTIKLERREPGAVQFSPSIEVGLGKEGESLAGGGGTASEGPKCIVTGGAATMTLTYQGTTFPICCTGCRDEFNESPEKYIKKASLLRSQAGKSKSNQPAPSRVSRSEDAFASDVRAATENGRMADQASPATPDSKKTIEKAEPPAVEAKETSPTKTKKAADKSAATKTNRAATMLRIAQNLQKDGKTDAALKNFRQIVKDFPGTPAAKTAAERIKALDRR